MYESIEADLQLAAVLLAEESSMSAAARRLEIDPSILRARIRELVARLEYPVFIVKGDRVEVTDEGRIIIDAFRAFLIRVGKIGP